MRKFASKLLFNWLPSAAASFIGGLALHLYLQLPAAPTASPKGEIASAAAAPTAPAAAAAMIVAEPNDPVAATVSEPARPSPPPAPKATRAEPKGKPGLSQGSAAVVARKRPDDAAVARGPISSENAKAHGGPQSASPGPIIGTVAPEVEAIAEGPWFPLPPAAPQPFSIVELKQKRRVAMAAEAAWSELPCDGPPGQLAHRRCEMKAPKALGASAWP